jgi:hypothetical protein
MPIVQILRIGEKDELTRKWIHWAISNGLMVLLIGY